MERVAAAVPPLSTPAVEPGDTAPRHRAPWGWLAVIDLEDCDPAALTDAEAIREFVAAVVPAVGMTAHGPLMIERFGDGELEGWSAVQFIETSTVTVHADEVSNRCFIDIISCKAFNADTAASLAEAHFRGRARVTVIERV